MLLSNHHQWSTAFFFFLNGGTQNKYPFLKVGNGRKKENLEVRG